MYKFLNSSSLFVYPSVLKGMSRIMDMFGYLDQYNYKETEQEADLNALKRDWSIIGLDIKNTLEAYEQDCKTFSATIKSS